MFLEKNSTSKVLEVFQFSSTISRPIVLAKPTFMFVFVSKIRYTEVHTLSRKKRLRTLQRKRPGYRNFFGSSAHNILSSHDVYDTLYPILTVASELAPLPPLTVGSSVHRLSGPLHEDYIV